jgi:hypothetical protein
VRGDRDTEIILSDLLELARQLGFREPQRAPKKVYRSQMVVKFDRPGVEEALKKWNAMRSLLLGTAERHYGTIDRFGALRIEFRSDFLRTPTNKEASDARQAPDAVAGPLRRWERLGLSKQSVIEWNGAPSPRLPGGQNVERNPLMSLSIRNAAYADWVT